MLQKEKYIREAAGKWDAWGAREVSMKKHTSVFLIFLRKVALCNSRVNACKL